jgi:hypothetical protein
MPQATSENEALGIALAGGAVLTAILDELLYKGILDKGEMRAVLERANNGLVRFYETDMGREAGRVIAGLLIRFPE